MFDWICDLILPKKLNFSTSFPATVFCDKCNESFYVWLEDHIQGQRFIFDPDLWPHRHKYGFYGWRALIPTYESLSKNPKQRWWVR